MANTNKESQNQHHWVNPMFYKHALAGSFAGIIGTIIGHPLDVVKTRLQTQNTYKGAIDCFIKVAKTEGVKKGLYRGIGPPLLNLTFLNTLSFSTYGQFKSMISEWNVLRGTNIKRDERIDSLWKIGTNEGLRNYQYFIAGAGCGFSLSFISTPFEFVKVRMQLDNITEQRFKNGGSLSCLKHLVGQHGVPILFKGYWINNFREILFCSIYFGFYEHSKYLLTSLFGSNQSKTPPLAILLSGGISGASAWAISFPLDVIKSNVQGQPLEKSSSRSGMVSIAMERWKSKGIKGFYNGIGPSITRACIVSSTRFSAYELAMRLLSNLDVK